MNLIYPSCACISPASPEDKDDQKTIGCLDHVLTTYTFCMLRRWRWDEKSIVSVCTSNTDSFSPFGQ